MKPSPGIEPGPHWWEASALTTTPSLPPQFVKAASLQKERAVNWVFFRVTVSNTNLHVVEQNITSAAKNVNCPSAYIPQSTYTIFTTNTPYNSTLIVTIVQKEYFAVNKTSITAKYSAYTIIQKEYFAVNITSITAKYSAYTIIQSENFAVNETSITAKYSCRVIQCRLICFKVLS